VLLKPFDVATLTKVITLTSAGNQREPHANDGERNSNRRRRHHANSRPKL